MRIRSLRRREFIAVLGATATWSLVGRAQQREQIRRVGVLVPFPKDDSLTRAIVTAFDQALGRLAGVEGKDIRIDYRFAGAIQRSSRRMHQN